jgi:hypothetical protein
MYQLRLMQRGNRAAQTGRAIMNYFLLTACAATLIGLSGNVNAAVNGINYDPAHDPAWIIAQNNDDFNTMKRIFDKDLTQIRDKLKSKTIKTYYSTFCAKGGPRVGCIDAAQRVQSLGLKVLLGVFEFREHKDWTDAQVSAAIAAAKTYPNTVIGIVVGNEDMFDDKGPANRPRFVPNRVMQKRIVTDITTIKNALKNAGVSIPVTTAHARLIGAAAATYPVAILREMTA